MIKNKLRSILKNRGISIVKLSKETGINRRTIYQFMNNKGLTYNLNTMSVICNYLNMNINDIIYYSEKELNFKIFNKRNSIDIFDTPFNANKENSCISRFSGYIRIIKNNKSIDDKKIIVNVFKYKKQYIASYYLNKTTNYEKSIFSNNDNMAKIVELIFKYILDYIDIMKVAKKQLDFNNFILSSVSTKDLNELSNMDENKMYDIQIIPGFYENHLNEIADSDLMEYSDSSLVNIKAKVNKSNNNIIDISNIKNKKKFGYLKHLHDKKLRIDGYSTLNIDE